MKIMIINHYAGSLSMGMEFRPYYFAREWIKLGHDVIIVAGDYSHLRKENPVVEEDFQENEIEKIKYVWIKTGVYSGNGVKRAFTMFRFVLKLWIHAKALVKKYNPDLVITSSTYPIDTFAGQKIAKNAKAKLIHEVHDMWPATLYEVGGMSRKNPFVQIMQLGENSAYKHSDKVVSLLPLAKEYMTQHGMREDKFVHIPNGIVLENWANADEIPQQHKAVLEQLKKHNKFIIGYFGGHALSNNLDILLDTAKITNENKIEYVLVGDGVEKEHLKERCEKERIENVTFLSPIPKLAIPKLVEYFDCSYIGGKKSPLYQFGICANKVYDSMMAAKPIIAAIEVKECEIQRYKCGFMALSDDPNDILEKILMLYHMKEDDRREIGSRGKKAAMEVYNYKSLADKFIKIFKENEV